MVPDWLNTLAAIHIGLSLLAALAVLLDILLLGRRQPMAVMEAVWPLTMLYWGPLGLVFYGWFGRTAPRGRNADAHQHHGGGHHADGAGAMQHGAGGHRMGHGGQGESRGPMWQAVFKGATHCGAGCALGDILAEGLAATMALTLFGSVLFGRLGLAFLLAYLFGILFQYLAVAPMRGLGLRDGLVAAVKIDTLSLLAYQAGMFAAMALAARALPGLEPASWAYWLVMQGAMVLGFATTYPVNWWLIRRGIKERM